MYLVDYLNVGSFIRIIIDNPKNIVLLFQNNNNLLESLFKSLLEIVGKNFTVSFLDYSDTKEYIYEKVELNEQFPDYVLKNKLKFKDWIL